MFKKDKRQRQKINVLYFKYLGIKQIYFTAAIKSYSAHKHHICALG